jgi:hypothetical protein
MKTRTRILSGTLAAAATLLGVQASANTQAFFTRPFNFTFGGTVFVPLNSAGETTVAYAGSGRRTIIYTAECANNAANNFTWVKIEILVDGVALSPANGDGAFCTSDGVAGHDAWVMAAIQGRTAVLGTGAHTVRVRATNVGGGTGWLGDSTLNISR